MTVKKKASLFAVMNLLGEVEFRRFAFGKEWKKKSKKTRKTIHSGDGSAIRHLVGVESHRCGVQNSFLFLSGVQNKFQNFFCVQKSSW